MKSLGQKIKGINIPWYVKNKYILTVFMLFTWVLLFDNFDLVTVIKMRVEINKKENEMEHLQILIEQDKLNYKELTSNQKQLEKFARENYLMKKENEDIFIILPEK
jgi:cell division protein FtsB